MRRWAVFVTIMLALAALVPGAASAQARQEQVPPTPGAAPPGPTPPGAAPPEGSVVVRVNSPVRIGPEDREGTVVAVNGDATVEGVVRDQVVVVNGAARISGAVEGDVVVVNGRLHLEPGARVHNVTLFRSTMSRAQGAEITGVVTERADFGWTFGLGAWLFWLSMTLLLILAGLLFAAVGGRQLGGAAALVTLRPGSSAVAAVLVWIVLPLLAVLLFFTIIGIPIGLAILVLLLPALWVLGYLVAGATLGSLFVGARRTIARSDHPYTAVSLGVLALQAISLIPFVGPVLVFLAGLIGGGALSLRAWRAARGERGPLTEPV